MDEEKLSKREKKELRKQERLQTLDSSHSKDRKKIFKWGVITVVALLFLGFFSYLVYSAKMSKINMTVASTGWVRGEESAPNTLYEFGDFQCPACKRYEPFAKQATKDFKGKMKFVFKHFPLTQIHKNALSSAIAAEAAGQQAKFWEMHDLLYEKQEEWVESDEANKIFEKYAKDLKLDVEKFKTDLKDKSLSDKILEQQNEGIALGVNSTPTFVLNDKQLEIPGSYEEFKKAIEAELK